MNIIANVNEVFPDITAAMIRQARSDAAATGRRVTDTLEERFGFTSQQFIMALARLLSYPVLSTGDLHRFIPAFDVLPFTLAQQKMCIAFRDSGGALLLAIGDPFDQAAQDSLEELIRDPFTRYLAHHTDIAAFLLQKEDSLRAMEEVLAKGGEGYGSRKGVEDLSLKAISEDTSPVVKLVRSTLYDALKTGASDIHLEQAQAGLAIKYRIDGVLTTVGEVAGNELAEQVVSRIKVMSELDIAERRIPQDGRFKVSAQGREVDCRVSIMPSIFGEDAVLRILDKEALSDQIEGLRLDYMGFDADILARMRRLCREPYGMVLVTGPTGSGKTTTIYAALSEINDGQDKIITIEDPVEYQLPGILQIPVNEKKGLSFARGLRSILRHDPDKIMVGEIRDPETAQIAVQAALTGHLVFTTVHANNVFDVIGRFLHMGVDPYSFVAAMNGILAQRLVRLNCPQCAGPANPDELLLADSGLAGAEPGRFQFRAGRGCGQCRGSGYKGRKAIGELLNLNDEIRAMIISREPALHLKEAARRNGTRFLRDAALDMAAAGETTLQEINRVTFVA